MSYCQDVFQKLRVTRSVKATSSPEMGLFCIVLGEEFLNMCNRYVSPTEAEIERAWHVGRSQPGRWWDEVVVPRRQGAFIRQEKGNRQLVAGQWVLIPFFAKTPDLRYSTNNARSEELADKASYRQPWARGQRCIIPAQSFDEPCWETGRNVWWRFYRADGQPWGLAGLWNTWANSDTGEIHESYTMLTVNADDHPLMRRMHKPKRDRAADAQDKRSVIAIEPADVQAWLLGTLQEAKHCFARRR